MKRVNRSLIIAILCLAAAAVYAWGLVTMPYPADGRQMKRFVTIVMMVILLGFAISHFLKYRKNSPIKRDNPVVDY